MNLDILELITSWLSFLRPAFRLGLFEPRCSLCCIDPRVMFMFLLHAVIMVMSIVIPNGWVPLYYVQVQIRVRI